MHTAVHALTLRSMVFATTAALFVSACGSGEPSAETGDSIAGEALFYDHAPAGLDGNGRACSDCHVDATGFQLVPADVEARFQQMTVTGVDDPLFRRTDADDFVTNGEAATDYSTLRQYGLIRVRLPLPPNIKLVDPTTGEVTDETFTDVWRSVPSVVNVALSGADPQALAWPRGPNQHGGYQLDGRVDTLQAQAAGAFLNHAQAGNAPAAAMLDDIAAYERTLRADAEPALDDLQAQGKKIFARACGVCHGGAGASTPVNEASQQMILLHDVHTNCPREVDTVVPARWSFAPCAPGLASHVRTYEIAFADGFTMRRESSDPGRALLTGYVASARPSDDGTCAHPPCDDPFRDDWQKLETAPLHGIAKTAPYFHNNSAATLEDVVIHYEEHYKLVNARNPSPPLPLALSTDGVHRDRPNVESERAALVAYLMVL
jgi:cytochrome c peroxidase